MKTRMLIFTSMSVLTVAGAIVLNNALAGLPPLERGGIVTLFTISMSLLLQALICMPRVTRAALPRSTITVDDNVDIPLYSQIYIGHEGPFEVIQKDSTTLTIRKL